MIMRIVTKVKCPIICYQNYCNSLNLKVAYTHPMNLKIHKQEHGGSKPFLCQVFLFLKICINKWLIFYFYYILQDCGKDFRTANRLKLHEAVHTGEKKFPCDNCDKRYASRSKVNRHMKLHCKVLKLTSTEEIIITTDVDFN